jgi:hypothetical protein
MLDLLRKSVFMTIKHTASEARYHTRNLTADIINTAGCRTALQCACSLKTVRESAENGIQMSDVYFFICLWFVHRCLVNNGL